MGNKEQRRGEYIEARVTRARPHDRFPILLEPVPSGSPTTFASRKAFSREAILLFNGSTLKSELLYNRQLGRHGGASKSSLDRKLCTRVARRRARIPREIFMLRLFTIFKIDLQILRENELRRGMDIHDFRM